MQPYRPPAGPQHPCGCCAPKHSRAAPLPQAFKGELLHGWEKQFGFLSAKWRGHRLCGAPGAGHLARPHRGQGVSQARRAQVRTAMYGQECLRVNSLGGSGKASSVLPITVAGFTAPQRQCIEASEDL